MTDHEMAYAVCENKCLVPTYSQEQIEELVKNGAESFCDARTGEKYRLWIGTAAEYDAIVEKENHTIYFKTDDSSVDSARTVNGVEIKKVNGILTADISNVIPTRQSVCVMGKIVENEAVEFDLIDTLSAGDIVEIKISVAIPQTILGVNYNINQAYTLRGVLSRNSMPGLDWRFYSIKFIYVNGETITASETVLENDNFKINKLTFLPITNTYTVNEIYKITQ